MSNGEGVNLGPVLDKLRDIESVQDRVESIVDNLRSKQDAMKLDFNTMKGNITDLEKKFMAVKTQLENMITSLDGNFKNFKKSMDGFTEATKDGNKKISEKLDDSIKKTSAGLESVSKGVESVSKGIGTVSGGIDKVFEETAAGNKAIVENLENSVQTTKTGLDIVFGGVSEVTKATVAGDQAIIDNIQESTVETGRGLSKVSTGVAMVEVLQGKFASGATETAIEQSLEEVQDRYSQAMVAVEEKQIIFDEHFNKIQKGFKRQLEDIGAHIFELLQENFEDIDELQMVLSKDGRTVEATAMAESDRIDFRSNSLDKQYKKMDMDELKKFVILKNRVDVFIENPEGEKFEVASRDDPFFGDSTVFGLPANVVSFNGEDEVEVYCLDSHVKEFSEKPVTDIRYDDLRKNIEDMCGRLDVTKCEEMKKDMKDRLKGSLLKLQTAGIISEDNYQLIIEHLDIYKLLFIEVQ